MTINNSTTIIRYNIRQFAVLLVYATIIAIIVFTALFELLLPSINKTYVAIVVSFAYLLFLIYNYIIDFNFISFSDEGDKFVFHFVSTRPLNKKRKAIEISKYKFDGYKIDRSFFGKKKEIVIFMKTQNGVAKYPPINISALNKSQIYLLTKSLKKA